MVRIEPVIAQNFVKLDTELQEILIANGAVPVNEVFFDTYNNWDFDILILYGGFGSGKSVFVVDKVIEQCLNDKYFKCMYGRKVYDTVRWSLFDTLCDRIEDRKLEKYFSYSRKPNSSMQIKCKENNNVFLPFGADNPRKMQSLKDASHFILEEMDQFEQRDFEIFITRLRTKKADCQLIGMFNTWTVYPDHWLKTAFFDETREPDPTLRKVFCNYPDNVFIDQEEYEKRLWIGAGYDEKRFNETAKGDWGSQDTRNLFAYAFNKKLHTVDIGTQSGADFMKLDSTLPVHLALDWNVDPMTCLVIQRKGMEWCKVIDEYRLRNSDIYDLCERILADYGDYYLVATGDASGRNRSATTRGKKGFILILKELLGLSVRQVQFPSRNPSVSDTRVLMNAIFKKHPKVWISSKCQFLVDDLLTLTVDEKGEPEKNKDHLISHFTDCLRYFFWNYWRRFLLHKTKSTNEGN